MKHRQSGFTLLEVMVALAIMAAIAVALTLLVSQVLDARRQLSEVREQSAEQLVVFLSRVDQQLTQLVVRQPQERGQAIGSSPLMLLNDNQELYWVAAGQWVLPTQDYASRLRLWRLQWHPQQQRLTLASSGLLDAAGEQQWTQVDELTGVTSLNWSYYRQGSWQTTLGGDFPRGLRLRIVWQDQQYERLVLLPEVMLIQPATPAAPAGQQSGAADE
ncbi:MAG: type II secretion system minor pseudopilin GspJ [Marinospirillum sp.]|uniref:type II secretion system minor pseudopilin GspJ n=1 Tax=Marinospirillum sp. TaxID=2183934 RepID=UPI0019E5D98B|nr:type II secretion system minor pseudopilin GspJ [Marinospirillum sp.]MBE0505861.1 type II secretion system minor pseudopilin GspJ [Marinospirillum sp.]